MTDDDTTKSLPKARKISIPKKQKTFFQKKKELRYWDKTEGEKTNINICHMTGQTEESLQSYIGWLAEQSPAVFALVINKSRFQINAYNTEHNSTHGDKDITAAAILETIGVYYVADAGMSSDIYTKQQIRYAQIALKGHRKKSKNDA